jgi:hypothetical protein
MIDSRIPRFSQAVQAAALVLAFLFDVRAVVPVLAVILALAVLGGPSFNLLARLYQALPIPPGEPERAAPPRFAQTLGAIFLALATVGLYAAAEETMVWWILGWGPALAVAVLAGLAATTSF